MRATSWCSVIGLSAVLACQPPAPAGTTVSDDPAAARAAINEANAQGVAAFNSGDSAAYVGVYGDGATIMGIGAPDLIGRHTVDSALGAQLGRVRSAGVIATWKADSIEVHGGYAYEVGQGMFVRPARAAGAAPDTMRTRYITFWRKGPDGRWRVGRDFTANVPRPTK